MSSDTQLKGSIVIKQKQEDGDEMTETALKCVHVTSGSANDIRYRTECPVYSKFTETQCDVIESISFDGKNKTFTYRTEKKRKATTEETASSRSFLLKISTASKEWCPVRIRVNFKENEGEVLFVKPLLSLDGYTKYLYSVALFMESTSARVKQRVESQKENYQMLTWMGFDMMLLIERRIRLEEMCRKMEAARIETARYWFDDDSDEISDEMPVIPDETPVVM